MTSVKIDDILVGLDIGTSKICALIGEVTPDGMNIIGMGSSPSKGIQKGSVMNIEAASQGIQHAIEYAEVMANCKISSVIVNISGSHIDGINSNGVAPVKDKEVSDADIACVLETAKAVAIPPDREFLHVLASEYILDNQGGIRNPKGMSGVRLEAKVHIVTGAVNCAQNIVKCVDRCNVDVADIVMSSLAAGEAVLSDDERELGCVLIDIGSGTTDIAVWSQGALVHSHVIGIGGNSITNDIATVLQILLTDAEKMKIQSGCAMASAVGADEIIEIPSTDGQDMRKYARQVLAEIIESRVREILEMVNEDIEKSGYKSQIPAGIIITGGTSMMDALPELAESVFGLPVKRGVPRGIGGLTDFVQNPQYATAVGLLLYAVNHPDSGSALAPETKNGSVFKRILDWFKQIV